MKSAIKDLNRQKIVRVTVLILCDLLFAYAAAFLALFVRFELDLEILKNSVFYANLFEVQIMAMVCVVPVFAVFKLYNSLWEFASISELVRVALASFTTTVLMEFVMHMFNTDMPRSFPIIFTMLLVMFCGLLRFAYRGIRRYKAGMSGNGQKRTMLIGGGQAGATVLREFSYSAHSKNKVVCIIDDDHSKRGNYIYGVKVVGGKEAIIDAAEKYKVEEIVIAIPSASRRQKLDILEICQKTGCSLRTLPGIYQLANGEVSIQKIREVDIEDLLGRDIVKINLEEVAGYITGKTVLVTGGGGSIGSELCRQAAELKPERLIIFDIYENNAYSLQMELMRSHPELDLKVLIGSVRDYRRVFNIFEKYKPDLVCHAAAHKHVPLMEGSPFEAIKNNVFGTYNVAKAAALNGTGRFILISTDKAVNPTNVMGASKRICEMIVQMWNECSDTEYVAVRFGNVLGSAGSVIPLFRQQIKNGGPVTVTDKNVIRYFMTIPEAVQLIFQAGAYAKGGEIFVLDMGEPVRIDDLARNMIRLSGLEPDVDIPVVYTGLRPGEKLYEELLLSGEGMQKTDNDLIYIGHEIEFDRTDFAVNLLSLKDMDETDEEALREKIAEIVPTYHRVDMPQKKHVVSADKKEGVAWAEMELTK